MFIPSMQPANVFLHWQQYHKACAIPIVSFFKLWVCQKLNSSLTNVSQTKSWAARDRLFLAQTK